MGEPVLSQDATMLLSIAEQAAERIVITDGQGVIQYVNPVFERITGYTKQEAVGKTPAILKSGKHPKAFYEKLWAALLAGRPFRATFINKRKNGDLYQEEQTISCIKDEKGKIRYFVSTAQDISRQNKIQEHLKQVEGVVQQMDDFAMAREGKITELKSEVNALLRELNRGPKYLL